MAASYPTNLPSFSNPTSSDYLNSPAHHTQHSSANDEIVAIATKVGKDSSAVTTTHDYKLGGVTSTAKAVSNTGNETIAGNKTFSGATTVAETIQTVTGAADGATVTFDVSKGNVHTVTLGGNRTLAISNETAGQYFSIELTQDGTGSRTVTWFSTIVWSSGTAPTLTTTAGAIDVFIFRVTSADNYLGFIGGQNLS